MKYCKIYMKICIKHTPSYFVWRWYTGRPSEIGVLWGRTGRPCILCKTGPVLYIFYKPLTCQKYNFIIINLVLCYSISINDDLNSKYYICNKLCFFELGDTMHLIKPFPGFKTLVRFALRILYILSFADIILYTGI